ncbi:retrotransposon protein, putative, Ty1-copia sub-class [Panicum miliaceum]|uniref:Retrotransposon protein, putative, Ty1-copia sub-class n=1 Tax=Panicum miliaceum TaxID=4540 RepID=A0A3L6PPP5_PANMI|nr:retrotransposon protein, putative, Ty1-copia sub-class [Panicum miliaceum]
MRRPEAVLEPRTPPLVARRRRARRAEQQRPRRTRLLQLRERRRRRQQRRARRAAAAREERAAAATRVQHENEAREVEGAAAAGLLSRRWKRRRRPSGRLRRPQQLGGALRARASTLWRSAGPVVQRPSGPWLRSWPRCAWRRPAIATSARAPATTTVTWGRRTIDVEAELRWAERHRRLSPSPERLRRASPSPERRRGGSLVVQTIVGTTPWPMLTKTNYTEWSSVIMVKLQVRQMWDVVRYGDVDRHEDRRVLEALLAAFSMEMSTILSGKNTAKDAWDAIAAARIGSDRARRSTLQKL